MARKKNNNLWLYIFIALALALVILFAFWLKPFSDGGSSGGSNGGSSGGNAPGQTIYIHDACSKCQARWLPGGGYTPMTFSIVYGGYGWQCSGTCDDGGSCYMGIGDPTNPYTMPSCSCGNQPSTMSCTSIVNPQSQRDCDVGSCTSGRCTYYPGTVAYTPYCSCGTYVL